MARLMLRSPLAILAAVTLAGCAIFRMEEPRERPTIEMNAKRVGHTATLLANGKILVVGGWDSKGLTTAELYDPTMRSFEKTGALLAPRVSHTATLLPSGKVLIAGGHDGSGGIVVGAPATTAELYDPNTGRFARTRGAPTIRCT